jgi:hypothetical protein
MSRLFKDSTIEKIESIRKYVLKAGIWTLIGGVVLGAIFILISDSSSGEIIGKAVGTLFIVAIAMMVSVNNFDRLKDNDPVVEVFATIGLIFNLIWAPLWIIVCWNAVSAIDTREWFSALLKVATTMSYLSALGFVGSNLMAIYEGEKQGIIRPLKITATACATYEMIYFTMAAWSSYDYKSDILNRLGKLAGFAGFIWVVIWIVVLVISRNEKKRQDAERRKAQEKKAEKYEEAVLRSAAALPKNETKEDQEARLRAEIEEKVRREMIEKEVREKLEKEQHDKAEASKFDQ